MSGRAEEHDRLSESLGAYVLGALEQTEAAQVDEHLERCAICAEEMEELRAVVDHLPAAVPHAAPPPELKVRIMAEVEAEASLLRAARGRDADRPEPVRRRRWLDGLALRPLALGLGCAALLVMGALGFMIGGSAQHGSPSRTVAARTIPARVQGPRAGDGRAALVRRGDQVALVVSHFPNPPRGRVYEVWLQRPDHNSPVPTDALFTVNSAGNAHVAVPGDLRGVKRVLVTDEPPGGSSVPSQLVPLVSAPTS
jgi:anti-sigma-K factor RskA